MKLYMISGLILISALLVLSYGMVLAETSNEKVISVIPSNITNATVNATNITASNTTNMTMPVNENKKVAKRPGVLSRKSQSNSKPSVEVAQTPAVAKNSSNKSNRCPCEA